MNSSSSEENVEHDDMELRLQSLRSFDDILSPEELESIASSADSAEAPQLIPKLPFDWDNYRLIERVGGGMNDVYLAQQTNLGDKQVVIKIIGRQSVNRRDLFTKESETLGRLTRLKSDGISVPLDYKVHDGVPFIVMEHVEGKDFEKVIQNESFSLSTAIEWIGEIAQTISQVHQEEVIHGDLKPGNLMLTESGKTKVIDFGLSAHWSNSKSENSFAGTRKYASPEQKAKGMIDARSDVFSLGLVFQELISAARPQNNRELEAGNSIASKMVQVDAEKRYQSMDQVAEAIDELVSKRNASSALKGKSLVGVSVLAVALAGFLVWQFLPLSTSHQPTTQSSSPDSEAKAWIASLGGRIENNPRGELKTAILDGCDVENADIEKLEFVESLEAIRFPNTPLNHDCLKFLPESVDHFYLDRTACDDRLFEELKKFRVRVLSVTHANITDRISEHLESMTTLEQLDLGSNQVGDGVAPGISKLNKLVVLSLTSTQLSDDGLKLIADGNLNLRQLHLARCKISDRSMVEISKMNSLLELGLDYCHRITDDGFSAIASLQNLEVLRFQECQISQASAVKTFSQMPNLREVFLAKSPKLDLVALQGSLGPNIVIHQ